MSEELQYLQFGITLLNTFMLMSVFYMLYTIGMNNRRGPRNGR